MLKYIKTFFSAPPKQPKLKDTTETYIETQLGRLAKMICHTDINHNIHPTIYDRSEFHKLMETPNNHLEREWQSRILLESTPRGTIIMVYDAYKEGFAYYSDITGIPYKLLNAVAAKYVTFYHCRDFFIDELVIPNNQSPFLKQVKTDQENEAQKSRMDTQLIDIGSKQNPFAKLKPSTKPTSSNNKSTTNNNNKITNKFLYRGKIHNFHPLQEYKPRKQPRTSISTSYDTTFKGEAEAQVNRLSYNAYKTLQPTIDASTLPNYVHVSPILTIKPSKQKLTD